MKNFHNIYKHIFIYALACHAISYADDISPLVGQLKNSLTNLSSAIDLVPPPLPSRPTPPPPTRTPTPPPPPRTGTPKPGAPKATAPYFLNESDLRAKGLVKHYEKIGEIELFQLNCVLDENINSVLVSTSKPFAHLKTLGAFLSLYNAVEMHKYIETGDNASLKSMLDATTVRDFLSNYQAYLNEPLIIPAKDPRRTEPDMEKIITDNKLPKIEPFNNLVFAYRIKYKCSKPSTDKLSDIYLVQEMNKKWLASACIKKDGKTQMIVIDPENNSTDNWVDYIKSKIAKGP